MSDEVSPKVEEENQVVALCEPYSTSFEPGFISAFDGKYVAGDN